MDAHRQMTREAEKNMSLTCLLTVDHNSLFQSNRRGEGRRLTPSSPGACPHPGPTGGALQLSLRIQAIRVGPGPSERFAPCEETWERLGVPGQAPGRVISP